MISQAMVELSRWQFAATSLYHFIFVPLTLGISWLIFIMELMYVRTGDVLYRDMTKFWGKLFGINFAIGVATGITLEFEFGTNWSNYSHYVGDIFGAPLAIEGLLAFFLESTFIGLFFTGWNRFSKKAHLAITFLTALGSNLSAMWILIANGWMQYPEFAVFSPEKMRMEMVDFFGLVLSPVAQVKFAHTVCAGYVTASMFVIGVSAFMLLKKRHIDFAKRSMTIALAFCFCAMAGSALTGDLSAVGVTKHQPAKLAAMEAEYETQKPPASWSVFAIPNEERIKNGVMAHKLLTQLRQGNSDPSVYEAFKQHDKDLGYGLLLVEHAKDPLNPTESEIKTAARNSVPSVWISYFSFRLMLGLLGIAGILVLGAAFFLWYKRDLENRTLFLKFLLWAIPVPFLACEFGWILAELGRQPWAIQGILPTFMATSSLSVTDVALSLICFIAIYTVFLLIEMYLMIKAVKKGPLETSALESAFAGGK